jgi:hypothetical protein
VQGGTYQLISNFLDGKPEVEANLLKYNQIKQIVEEEQKPDPKL